MLSKSEWDLHEQKISQLFTDSVVMSDLPAFIQLIHYFRSQFPIVPFQMKQKQLEKFKGACHLQSDMPCAQSFLGALYFNSIGCAYNETSLLSYFDQSANSVLTTYLKVLYLIYKCTVTNEALEQYLLEIQKASPTSAVFFDHLRGCFAYTVKKDKQKALEFYGKSRYFLSYYFMGHIYYELAEEAKKTNQDDSKIKYYELAKKNFLMYLTEAPYILYPIMFYYLGIMAERPYSLLDACKWFAIGQYYEGNQSLVTNSGRSSTNKLNEILARKDGLEQHAKFVMEVFSSIVNENRSKPLPYAEFIKTYEDSINKNCRSYLQSQSVPSLQFSAAPLFSYRTYAELYKISYNESKEEYRESKNRLLAFYEMLDTLRSAFPIMYVDRIAGADHLLELRRKNVEFSDKTVNPRQEDAYMCFYYYLGLGSLKSPDSNQAGLHQIYALKTDREFPPYQRVPYIQQYYIIVEYIFSGLLVGCALKIQKIGEILKDFSSKLPAELQPFVHCVSGLLYYKGHRYYRGGKYHTIEHNFDKAIRKFEKALAGGYEKACFYAGEMCFIKRGTNSTRLKKAKEYLEKYIFEGKYIVYPAAFYYLHQIYLSQGDLVRAGIYLCIGKLCRHQESTSKYMEMLSSREITNLSGIADQVEDIRQRLQSVAVREKKYIPFSEFYKAVESELTITPASIASLQSSNIFSAASGSSSGSSSSASPTPSKRTLTNLLPFGSRK